MKIIMIGPSYPFKGGIAQYTTALFDALSATHDVRFLSFKRQYPDWLYPGKSDRDQTDRTQYRERTEPVIDSLNPWTWWVAVRKICAFNPEMVLLPWWVVFWTPLFLFLKGCVRICRPDIRWIFICHNVQSHDPSRVVSLLTWLTLRTGDGFLVHAQSELNALKRIVAQRPVLQVEHPSYAVDDTVRIQRDDAKATLGVSGDLLLFFGYIRPYKGVDTLLEAMPYVLQHGPVTLVIAGEVWGDLSRYVKKVESMGIADRVQFLPGYVSTAKVPTLFAAADVVVLPYLSVTGSGVVKLAYSFGRGVVVSDVGSLPEAVEPGQTGFVVPPGDPRALARSISDYLHVIDRPLAEQRALARATGFSWQSVVASLEKLFEQVRR